MITEQTWLPVPFGKHKGKTLPQIVLSDPDWFFWGVGNNIFRDELLDQSQDVAYKSCFIKIAKPDPENWRIEYQFTWDGNKFVDFSIIDTNTAAALASSTEIAPYLDLSVPRRRKFYDKMGSQLMVSRFRHYYFAGKKLTRDRCEDFFNQNSNFVWMCELPELHGDAFAGADNIKSEHRRCDGNTCIL